MDFNKESNNEFDKTFHKLLGHEGGYSNHKSDTGGETMWGVTVAVARANGYKGQMKDLPIELAKQIYRKSYWDAVKAEELPQKLRYGVFDAAVNSGTTQAVKWLQQALGVLPDGAIGAMTLQALQRQNPDEVLMKMLGYRLQFMTDLKNWSAFGKGWARRIASLLKDN